MKALLFISSSFILGIGTVILLFQLSDRINHAPNHFFRLYPTHPYVSSKEMDVQYNTYYIGGITNSHIYLIDSKAPLYALAINFNLTDTQHIKLNVSKTETIKLVDTFIAVDSPHYYITNGISPAILRGVLPDKPATKLINDSLYFNLAMPLSKASFVLRNFDARFGKNVLFKQSVDPRYNLFTATALERQVDGFFCTDGFFLNAGELSKILYVYYYRNQFICLDTNLNVLYKGRTIDTNSLAKIKIASNKAENKMSFASPPLLVNRTGCVWKEWLFIQSRLAADNEKMENFNQSSVIDVYNINTGKYRYSFYLPDFHGYKMSSFKVCDQYLVTLYGNYMRVYTLAPNIFR